MWGGGAQREHSQTLSRCVCVQVLYRHMRGLSITMKQTLSTLIALAGLATAEDVTFSSTAAHAGYGGLDFSISQGSWLVANNGQWDYDKYQYGILNSVTLTVYPAGYTQSNMTTGFGIGIYEKQVNGDATTWMLVGKTDWVCGNADKHWGELVFHAQDDVILSVDKTYTMAFFAGSEYFDSLYLGSKRYDMSGGTCWVGGQPAATTDSLAAVGLLRETGDATGMVVLYAAGNQGEETGVTPYAEVNVSPFETGGIVPSNVPEPTTTTLGLLALCGLASRRRRA